MTLIALMLALALQAAGGSAPAPPPAAPVSPPSLDEALGLEGAGAVDTPGSDLDAALAGAPPKDILESALADMKRSLRLLEARETGLPTKRVQESVVRKLDELIATAQRMQQQQQQQQQQQGRGGQQRGQRQEGQRDGGERQGANEPRPAEGDGSRQRPKGTEGEAADRREGAASEADATRPPDAADPGDGSAQFDESRVEWGQLPPRVREAVRQGVRDPMSAAYRRLTQEYYRRLAEEGRR